MKFLLFWSACFFVGIGIFSCTKKTVDGSAHGTGVWNLVYDSGYIGVGLNNHVVVYHGRKGDYFNFGDNDTLYTSENGKYDTSTYQLYSNTAIAIAGFGITINGAPDTCTIDGYNTSRMTITTSFWFPTPGGLFGRTVILSR